MRNIKTVVLAVVIIMFGASFVPVKKTPAPIKAAAPKAFTNYMFTNYIWYNDADFTDPTGTYCDISTEISRLQALFGGYIFSSAPSMNLHEYEWGYYPYLPDAIIYSDRVH